jgi:hypothetical protein
MSQAASTAAPRLLRAIPGRVRLHVPGISAGDPRALEAQLSGLLGVRSVQSSRLTENVLVLFDPRTTTGDAILLAIPAPLPGQAPGARRQASGAWPQGAVPASRAQALRVVSSDRDGRKRAHIAVRGLERSPAVARRVIERLERRPGVRARVSLLTGRVRVEFDERKAGLTDLLCDLAEIELPDLPDEDNPTHPLDPAPLLQSAARSAAAIVGLGLISARQVAGLQVAAPSAATAAAFVGILHGFPLPRHGLRALLGRDLSDLLFNGAGILALALSGSLLGLALSAVEALRLLSEVVARRAAWRRYEEQLGDGAEAMPGATIRLVAGERAPLGATVVEGTGTAIERDGAPVSLGPGVTISAGARLHGGPFVVTLDDGQPFEPRPRPAPPAAPLRDRYPDALSPISVAYAAVTAIVTRSLVRAFETLLLVNPRTALIGAEAASIGASARVLRAGVVVVGTRPDRPIRRPDALLLDGPRVLTDGLELADVAPLGGAEATEMQNIAAAVAEAAGSPWGAAFTSGDRRQATGDRMHADNGAFDGLTARASVDGVVYTLGTVMQAAGIPAAERLHTQVSTTLVLQRERDARALALCVLRPQLAPGVADLVETCGRHGVEVALLGGTHDARVARGVARRAGLELLDGGDVVAAALARQARGGRVAVVSDSAHAAEAFAACDLAIGLTSSRGHCFAARADLLAPDLYAVAAIFEAGARREHSARDAVALSVVANVAGAILGGRGGAGIARASTAVYLTSLAALAAGWARLGGGAHPRAVGARLAGPSPSAGVIATGP